MIRNLVLSFGKKAFLLIFTIFVAVLDGKSQDQTAKPGAGAYPSVPVPGTEMRTFYSDILKQQMNLYIKLPSGYYANPGKIYQAWYFTDANRTFPLVANIESIFDILPAMSSEPEVIIVGIGYQINDMGDWAAWRTRDLTPVNLPRVDSYWADLLERFTGKHYTVQSGGADKFLNFVVKEVFPLIESNYRVSTSDRGIGGYSYGGLFSLYTLFTRPDLFTSYYAGSPSIDYGNGTLFELEKAYASSHNNLKAHLFMSAGGSEDSVMVSNVGEMANLLKSRNYPGLEVETHIFPGETHPSCLPSSVMWAFKVLYKRN